MRQTVKIIGCTVEVFANNLLIDKGEKSAGKYYAKDCPEQYVCIMSDGSNNYSEQGFIEGEVMYTHSEDRNLWFREYDNLGRLAYDSRTHKQYEIEVDLEAQYCMHCHKEKAEDEFYIENLKPEPSVYLEYDLV
ncbi:MAG: hypothetical protein MJA82_21005 [Clostridia bacterium]|nr:hypothetical protein [Clostridia bacterium]